MYDDRHDFFGLLTGLCHNVLQCWPQAGAQSDSHDLSKLIRFFQRLSYGSPLVLDSFSSSDSNSPTCCSFSHQSAPCYPNRTCANLPLCNQNTHSSGSKCQIDDRKVPLKPEIQRNQENHKFDDPYAYFDSSGLACSSPFLGGLFALQATYENTLTRQRPGRHPHPHHPRKLLALLVHAVDKLDWPLSDRRTSSRVQVGEALYSKSLDLPIRDYCTFSIPACLLFDKCPSLKGSSKLTN